MALSRKYPKHVRVTGTTLNYQRGVPKRLAHLTSRRLTFEMKRMAKLRKSSLQADKTAFWRTKGPYASGRCDHFNVHYQRGH